MLTIQNFRMLFILFSWWLDRAHRVAYEKVDFEFKRNILWKILRYHYFQIYGNNGSEFWISSNFFFSCVKHTFSHGTRWAPSNHHEKRKKSCWNFGLLPSYIHCKYLKIRTFWSVHANNRSYFKFGSLALIWPE